MWSVRVDKMQKIFELSKFGSSTEHSLDFDFVEALSGRSKSPVEFLS